MKAMVMPELGDSDKLVLQTVEDPHPSADEVVVRLRAAALNRRDLYAQQGQYPGVHLPAIPGSDGAGVVAEVGEHVRHVKVGDSVLINPALHWGEDERFYGPDFEILGIPSNGTYAQLVVVPAENVFPKPAHLSFEEAAALPLAGLTAWRAVVTRGKLAAGETVVIPGIGGGVATFVLQICVALGAKVYVTSSSEAKLARAKEMGAAGGVNYKADGWQKQLRQLCGGADLSIDSVGGETFVNLIYVANPGGRIVVFGATTGPVHELVLPRLFFKQLDIRGTTMGSPKDFADMLAFYEKMQLHPVVDAVYPLEEAAQAQQRMAQGEQFGKIVLRIPQEQD